MFIPQNMTTKTPSMPIRKRSIGTQGGHSYGHTSLSSHTSAWKAQIYPSSKIQRLYFFGIVSAVITSALEDVTSQLRYTTPQLLATRKPLRRDGTICCGVIVELTKSALGSV